MGISRVSDALQAHTWPHMEMTKKPGESNNGRTAQDGAESSDKAAATGGEEGDKGGEKIERASREGLGDLETKAAASLTGTKEEARSKVGKSKLVCLLIILLLLNFSLSLSQIIYCLQMSDY